MASAVRNLLPVSGVLGTARAVRAFAVDEGRMKRAWWLLLAGATVCVAVCCAKPAAAESNVFAAETPVYDDLEGTLGSRLVAARFSLRGRTLGGNLVFSASGDTLDIEGELFAQPLSDGLTSCSFGPDAISAKRRHGGGRLTGICEVRQRDGESELSFEGFWREPGHSEEPVVLTSRRTLAGRAWQRYGALLPQLAPATGYEPPAGCASTPAIAALTRNASLVYIVHSRHFHCVEPEYELEWSSYAVALSVVDDSGASPVWLSTTPIVDPVHEARDVVDWAASMSGFWLAPNMLGLVVTSGGTISGSGLLTNSDDLIFAIAGRSVPQLLLSVAGDDFGKSSIADYGSTSVTIYATKPQARPALVTVSATKMAMIDGVDQDPSATSAVYRFDPKRIALIPTSTLLRYLDAGDRQGNGAVADRFRDGAVQASVAL